MAESADSGMIFVTKQLKFKEKLLEFVERLHGSELFTDINVHYGEEVFKCHKFVIYNNTTYWGDLKDIDEIYVDEQVEHDVLLTIVRWMYTFKFSEKWGFEFLIRLMETSNQFQMIDLLDVCSYSLLQEIEVSNCVPIYESAVKINAESLQKSVSDFIATQWHYLEPFHFKDVPLAIVIELVKKNSENVIPALVKIGRRDTLNFYLESNNDSNGLNVADEHGLFPLDIAFDLDNLDIACILHNHGADVNATNESGICLLAKAVEKGNINVLTFLVENGANVNYISWPTKKTLLHDLTLFTEKREINEWVKDHINLFDVNAVDQDGRSPLFYAIDKQNGPILDLLLSHDNVKISGTDLLECALFKHGSFDVAGKLIHKGAALDFEDEEGNTVFHRAVNLEQWSLVEFLVQHTHHVDKKNNIGLTPLHVLLSKFLVKSPSPQSMAVDILKILLKCGADPCQIDDSTGQTALHYAPRLPAFILHIILDFCKDRDFSIADKSGNSPLWNSLKGGVFEAALVLVEAGADVNEGASTGNSLLLRAVTGKRDDIFNFLVSKNVNVNVESSDGLSCLLMAVKKGLTSIVDTLCKLGASMNSTDPVTNETPLWISLKNSDYGTAQVLVSHGCDLEAPTLVDGVEKTLLQRAIEERNGKVSLFLINSGCDVNSCLDTESPLHLSMKNDLLEVVSELLSNLRCKVDYKNNDGNTIAHLAVLEDNKDVLNFLLAHPDTTPLLLRNKSGQTPLCIAMEQKNNKSAEAICKRLPHAALQVNSDGESLLHVAIKENNLEAVLFLLGLQIDVNIPTENTLKLPPLHLSARYSSDLIMRNIILAGANLDAADSTGKTALHEAAKYDRAEHIKILLENGADTNLTDNEGNNPLHLAVLESAFISVQTLLLESAVNPMAVNKMKRNAVHLCANISGLSAAEMFQTLIEILPNYPLENGDIHGNTAFLLAFVNGNGDLCRLMLKYGVCLSTRNKKGESVFHLHISASNLLENLLVLLDREPKWSEGDECSHCESKFTLTMRKHHCRHCGRLVCGKCSELQMPILKYNLSKNVRVCQICYSVLTTGLSLESKPPTYPLEKSE